MTRRGILFALGIVLGIILFLPTTYTRTLVKGVDSYNTHRLVFGNRTFSQQIVSHNPISGVGVVVVDIRNSNNLAPVDVSVRDAAGNILGRGIIDPASMADDVFATTYFDDVITLPDGTGFVDVRSPQATTDNAIGWRYDPAAAPLTRFENSIPQTGSFAIQIQESVSLLEKVIALSIDYKKEVVDIVAVLGGMLLFAALAVTLQGDTTNHPNRLKARYVVIGVIAIAAFAVRMYVQQDMGGVSGGDPYNYLSIAQSIAKGENPFAGSKRLPGYPLLLTPTIIWPDIDVHVYMRTLSGLASTGSVILVFLLAQQLRLAWPAQLFAASALAWQADFFATSLRPEPYSLFGFLLLACVLLFFTASTKRMWLLFGVLLGYAALVRQEGFVLAAILGIAATIREVYLSKKTNHHIAYQKLLWMFLPALTLVSPFFISNIVHFGNPLYTEYFEGERLQIVDSWHAFNDASLSTWGIITSMWKPSWIQEEILKPYDDAVIPIAFLVTIAWWVAVVHKKIHLTHPRVLWGAAVVALAACLWAAWYIGAHTIHISKYPPMIVTGVLLAAPALFFVKTGWRGILVAIVLTSQLLIATWFHPFAKHYQQSYPLIALMIASVLFHIQLPKERSLSSLSLFIPWLVPFALPLLILYSHLGVFLDSHNAAAAYDSVMYRAARVARTLPGPYAYTVNNLPAQIYHGTPNITEVEDTQQIPATIQTFVVINEIGALPQMPALWHKVTEYKSEGKNEVLYVSQVWTR